MAPLSSRVAASLTCSVALCAALAARGDDSSGPGDDQETIAVVAVGEPPAGPSPQLAEVVHQLRSACRDRRSGVLDIDAMRGRLVGPNDAIAILERAYVGAQAAFQADEIDSALHTLQRIIADLERVPESGAAHALWVRAHLRLALAHRAMNHPRESAEAMERILAVEPAIVVDPDQFSPSFRRDFDEARRRVREAAKHDLVITSPARSITAFVNGKEVGATPVTIALPPGRYRVGGGGDALRVPAGDVVLGDEDRTVALDAPLGEAIRIDAGPGLALAAPDRAPALVRAGAWLGADLIVALELAGEGTGRVIRGSLYDVVPGALVREGHIPFGAGSPGPARVGALASFLLAGTGSSDVSGATFLPAKTAAPTTPPQAISTAQDARRRPRWLRPAAYGAGAVALGLAAFATAQSFSSRNAGRDASALVRSDGALVAGTDRARYDALVASADAARRNAYLGAAGAVGLAVVAGVLGYLSFDARAAPVTGPAVRF